MRIDILTGRDQSKVRTYITGKFTKFKSWKYSKASRRKKCRRYYDAASESNHELIKSLYLFTFKEALPESDGLPPGAARKPEPVMVSADDWLEEQRSKIARSAAVIETLKRWRDSGEYQTGEEFFLKLKTLIADFDPSLCDPRELRSEHEARMVANLTHSHVRTAREVSAEFEGMVGIHQKAGIHFEAYSPRWGEINAKLEEEFRAGAWTSGSAKAKMERLGFSAEIQAAVAFGAQLDISGQCQWKKGKLGLGLEGQCTGFAGGKAAVGAKLSVSALKGIEAAIEAGAFIGFSATARGAVSFSYGDADLVRAEAEASISFGLGAEFKASIAAPIFGPTAIEAKGEITVGVGGGVGFNLEINFTEMGLAASSQFRKLIYLPTIIRGYEMTLMTSDRRNLHYLDKCEGRLGDGLEEIREGVEAYYKVPPEKRRLLMSLDD